MTKKKKIIIISLIILFIIMFTLAVILIVRYNKINETTGNKWSDIYYEYIMEMKKAKDKTSFGLNENSNKISLNFIQVIPEKNPIMILNVQDEGNFLNIYYIDNQNQAKYVKYDMPISIEYLYNVNEEKYSWYIHTLVENHHKYQSIQNVLELLLGEQTDTQEIVFEEEDYVQTEENMNLSKFEQNFIETYIKITEENVQDLSLKDLETRNQFVNALNKYKDNNELITENVKQITNNKLIEIEKIENEKIKLEELEKAKLTNSNVNNRIGENLKWFTSAYLGSTYGWRNIYEYKDVTEEIKIPGQNEFMMVYELVGLDNINTLQKNLNNYMTSNVITKLMSNPEYNNNLVEFEGKVYWLTGGIGDGPEIDYTKAEVISSDGNNSKVLLENYETIGNTKTQEIILNITLEENKYLITDYEVKNTY